jgi:hypothetical protein
VDKKYHLRKQHNVNETDVAGGNPLFGVANPLFGSKIFYFVLLM